MLPAGLSWFALALFAVARPAPLPVVLPVQCSRMDRPIVAEVYYDATGDDTGHEFVELLNRSEPPARSRG
jgi:hypothetical protein